MGHIHPAVSLVIEPSPHVRRTSPPLAKLWNLAPRADRAWAKPGCRELSVAQDAEAICI